MSRVAVRCGLLGLICWTAWRFGHMAGVSAQQQREVDAEREREREREQARFREGVHRALEDLHGRIDAERWLASFGEPEAAPADAATQPPGEA